MNRPSAGFQRAVDNALLVVSSVPTGPLASLVVRPSSRTMVVGQAASFSAHGVDAAMNGIPIAASAVAWSMTGSGATLSSSGLFQAREPGSATVTAVAAGLTGASDMNIVADTFAPVAADPDLRLRRGGTVEAGSVPVTISWAAATDVGTGVAGYELRRRFSGEPWTDVALPSLTARTSAASAARQRGPIPSPGDRSVRQCRRLANGGRSGHPTGRRGFECRALHRDLAKAVGIGLSRWDGAHGSDGRRQATFGFTGRQVAWIAVRGPTRGSARVAIDGSRVGLVRLHADTVRFRKEVFVSAWMPSGSHRISVRVSGTAGHPRVDVDGFASSIERPWRTLRA